MSKPVLAFKYEKVIEKNTWNHPELAMLSTCNVDAL